MLAQGTTVGNLPVEIIQRICGELKTLPDLLNVACTCKAASLLAQDPQVIAAVLLNRIRYGSIVSYEIQIKYLAPSVTEKLLCDFFASCDVITSCQIRSGTRMRKHEAFIRFQTLQGLKRALALNGRFMRGGALSITNASSQNRKVKLLELTASIGYATTALIDWCTVDSPSGTSVKGGTDAEIPLQVHRPYGVIKILKARGARVSGQKSQHEKTETRISKFSLIDDPLYFAVRSGQISIVKELLDCGANPFLNSHAALIHAVSRGYNAIAVTIASFQYKSASQSANAKLLASELMEFAINLSLRYFSKRYL
ncbi:hypothetical protein BC829DRAFT_483306 [Chytridium lagenaria]|nr:hypothetical protein BC829DRAFT_483306 [Chytridium lagenaria]